ncbi:hypothetical protein RFZ03_06750, partial [Acinetobacter baumannii]|nr:hypothetical protein [Acinetobacter baumannii]
GIVHINFLILSDYFSLSADTVYCAPYRMHHIGLRNRRVLMEVDAKSSVQSILYRADVISAYFSEVFQMNIAPVIDMSHKD